MEDIEKRTPHENDNKLSKSFDYDYHYDNINNIVNETPDFDSFEQSKRLESFYKYLDAHWRAMQISAEYDFAAARLEVEHLVANREKLGAIGREFVKKTSRTKQPVKTAL